MQCNVWDAHLGSVIPMTATPVPFYYMQHASPGTMHDSAALSAQSVVDHCVLIAMLSAGCKLLIVVWNMRVLSMLKRSNVCQMTHSARRFWTRCCCTVPVWSESCVSHLPMVATQIRYSTVIMHCVVSQAI